MNKFIEVVTNFGNKLSQDRRDFEEETFPNNSIAMNEDAVFPSDDTVITLTPEQ
jgi:hypothetical protein